MIGVERFVSWQSVMAHWPRLFYHDTSLESDGDDDFGDDMVVKLIVEIHCYMISVVFLQKKKRK